MSEPGPRHLQAICDAHIDALRGKFENVIIIATLGDNAIMRHTDMSYEIYRDLLEHMASEKLADDFK